MSNIAQRVIRPLWVYIYHTHRIITYIDRSEVKQVVDYQYIRIYFT